MNNLYRTVLVAYALGASVQSAPTQEVCTAEKCVAFAKHLKDSLSPNYQSIDPCVDFDRYSCEGWRASHEYRPDQARVSVTSVLSDQIRDTLHAILEGVYAENTTFTGTEKDFDIKNFMKLKTAYNTCMNEDAIKTYGVTPIRQLLDQFEALYPASVDASRSVDPKTELTQTVAWLSKNGKVSGLLSSSTSADDMNPDTVLISLGASELEMQKRYYTMPIPIANYTRAIAEMTHVIWTGKTIDENPISASENATLYAMAKRVVDFEILIASKTPEPEEQSDVKYFYNIKTLGDLEKQIPEISITKIIQDAAPAGYTVDEKRTVNVNDKYFYGNLSNIIKSTPRQTLHDYFQWRLISTWNGAVHKDFNAPMRRFNNRLLGREPDALAARWRTCIGEVDAGLGHILGGVFISRMFTKKDKQLGDQVIQDVKNVFAENLKTLDWMSASAKEVAARKVVNIISKVGYQTKNPNEEKPQELHDYYSSLAVANNYFNNARAYAEFGRVKTWNDLLKPTDRDRWEMTSPTVNAYYNPPINEIVFPAGIMQIPFFNGELPEYANYGGFGSTAGHELTHGFDDNGAKYDDTGRYREWWDNSTTVRFENETTCFVKQYDKFSVEGLEGERVPVNGKLTLGENIADAGGLNAAFRAWKKRDLAKTNPTLPGLEKFTNDQLFFVSYANSWCGKIRKEALLKQVLSDPHAPDDTRTLGPVANSPEFRQAFNCPVKQPTCIVW